MKPLPAPVRFDRDTAERAIREYNAGSYRGCSNVALDRAAYDCFAAGLADDGAGMIELVRFVGEDYGGAQRRFLPHGYREEAALIVARLVPVLGRWRQLVADAKLLLDAVPDETTVRELFAPFAGTKRWPVWCSKTLHFLRPDAFPILDSLAKNALGLAGLDGTPRNYRRFCEAFRATLLANQDVLAAARSIDAGASPSDIKLLDKILYQIG